jgi:hypothetical protein
MIRGSIIRTTIWTTILEFRLADQITAQMTVSVVRWLCRPNPVLEMPTLCKPRAVVGSLLTAIVTMARTSPSHGPLGAPTHLPTPIISMS